MVTVPIVLFSDVPKLDRLDRYRYTCRRYKYIQWQVFLLFDGLGLEANGLSHTLAGTSIPDAGNDRYEIQVHQVDSFVFLMDLYMDY